MHMLIATSGVLSPDPVVDFTRHLLGQNGRVTLITVIEVAVTSYLDERGRKIVEPIRSALESAQIPSEVRFVEGNDAAAAISNAASTLEADIVVLGATRSIFNREAWESVSARVMLESDRPVLVVPAPQREDPRTGPRGEDTSEDPAVVGS